MRKNEHPRCGCDTCRRGSATGFGKYVHRCINRKIRHKTKDLLKKQGEDFEPVIISTPYTD